MLPPRLMRRNRSGDSEPLPNLSTGLSYRNIAPVLRLDYERRGTSKNLPIARLKLNPETAIDDVNAVRRYL